MKKLLNIITRGESSKAIPQNEELTPSNRIRLYIEEQTGTFISRDKYNNTLRDYNRFEMPLTQRTEQILANPEPFLQFYKNRENQQKQNI